MKTFKHYIFGMGTGASLLMLTAMGFTACDDDDSAERIPLSTPAIICNQPGVSSVTVQWNRVEGATQYGYKFTDPSNNIIAGDIMNDTTITLTSLTPNTLYTLQVRAYAPVTSKTYCNSDIALLEIATPGTTTLSKPSHLAVEGDLATATLTWYGVNNASAYTIRYAIGDSLCEASTSDTTYTTQCLPQGSYVFGVLATSTDEAFVASDTAAIAFTTTSAQLSTPRTLKSKESAPYTVLSWMKMPHADFYSYKCINKATLKTIEGTVTDKTVSLPALPSGNYLFAVASCSDNTGYITSEYAITEFSHERNELWRTPGVYTSADPVVGGTWDAQIVAYSDNSYTLERWYGAQGYDLTFAVNADSTLNVLNYEYINNGYYNVPTGLEDSAYMGIYPTDGYSQFTGDANGGNLYFYAAWAGSGYDTFTWGESNASTKPSKR